MTEHQAVFLSALGVLSALGRGKRAVLENMIAGRRPGIVSRDGILVDGGAAYVGAVDGPLPMVPERLAVYASRNTRMLIAAVDEIRADVDAAIARFGPARIAVVMGTSTSGVEEGERALRQFEATGKLPAEFDFRQQEVGSVGEVLARYLELQGPAYTVSTACSSGAQALAAGRRLLRTGLADAVLAGGADSLCRLTVNGFDALSAMSANICNPFSRNRDGTTIAEGAAVFLMQREESDIALYGVGASSDAYSMTAPEPEGVGAEQAMRQALADAGLTQDAVDYIQLHGSGTEQNDAMESKAVIRLFGEEVPCSSSKGQVGHTLGAAGAIGAAHCWLTAHQLNESRALPPNVWDGEAEEGLLGRSLVQAGQTLDGNARGIFMSNAFAFGGSNMSLVLGRWQ